MAKKKYEEILEEIRSSNLGEAQVKTGTLSNNKLKQIRSQQLETAKADTKSKQSTLKTSLDNKGIVSGTGLTLAPNQLQVQTENRKKDLLTEDSKKKKNKEDLSIRTAAKESQENIKKYNEYTKTNEGKTAVDNILNARYTQSKAQYNYNVLQAQEDYENKSAVGKILTKTAGAVGRGIFTTLIRSDDFVTNANGERYELPSYAEIYNDVVQQNYTTKIGKIAGSVGFEVGRMATSAALNSLIPGLGTTTYFTDMYADQYNQTMQEGYSGNQALLMATIGTATELATEKLLGGAVGVFTKGTTSEVSSLTSKALKGLIKNNQVNKIISNASGEALEEFVQEYLGALQENIILGKDNKFDGELFKNACYSALVGALSSGVMGTSESLTTDKAVKTIEQVLYNVERSGKIELSEENKTKLSNEVYERLINGESSESIVDSFKDSSADKKTGLSNADNMVIDTLLKERTGDKNLTKQEAKELRNEIIQDLKDGKIEVSKLEEILGGDATKEYYKFKGLVEENKELRNKKMTDMTAEEYENSLKRRQEIESQLEKYDENELAKKYAEEMNSKVSNADSLLQNVFKEDRLRSEAYKQEGKYSEKAQKVIDEAKKTGVLNNSTKTHQVVDFISKIIDRSGAEFEFTNNDKLKDTKYEKEGKFVNGYKEGNKIVINVDGNFLQTTAGHEITHIFEKTKAYKGLAKAVTEYAETKGDLENRYNETAQRYYDKDYDKLSAKQKATIEQEIVADLVGEYVVTDQEFANKLAKENRNFAEKILDEIKYLYKIATTGSAEKKQLLKAQHMFEKALEQASKVEKSSDTQFMFTDEYSQYNYEDIKIRKEILDSLKEAKKLDSTRNPNTNLYYTNEEIRQKTGWFKDRDGNWKREISDKGSRFVRNIDTNTKTNINEILYHPELFELYGDLLSDMYVEFKNLNDEYGIYHPSGNYITLDLYTYNNDKEKAFTTLLHEIQHAIQTQNNWSNGSNKDGFNYAINKGEIEADNVSERFYFTEEELNSIPPRLSKSNPRHRKAKEYLSGRNVDKLKYGTYNVLETGGAIENSIRKNLFGITDNSIRNDVSDISDNKTDMGEKIQRNAETDKERSKIDTNKVSFSISNEGKLQDQNGNDIKLDASKAGNTGTLMAIHNLNEDKLRGILELGGFPSPSIAISNKLQNGFGDISVLFSKNTIDPSNPLNEVYDRDAYTPRVPRVINKYKEEIYDVANKLGISESRLENYLENSNFEESLSRLLNNDDVKNKYLKDNNVTFEDKYIDKNPVVAYNSYQPIKDFVIKNDITIDKLFNDENLRNEYINLVQEFQDSSPFKSLRYVDGLNLMFEDRIVTPMKRLDEDFNLIKNPEQEIDVLNREEQKRNYFKNNNNNFRKYISNLLNTINEGKYIETMVNDYLNEDGSRKTFDEMYKPYNLTNILEEMLKKDNVASESSFATFGSFNASSANRLNSLEEIKQNENRLVEQSVEKEENQELVNKTKDLVNIISNTNKIYNANDPFYYANVEIEDSSLQTLQEIAYSNDFSYKNISKIFKENYLDFSKLSESEQNDVIDLLKKMKKPNTEYFEAKPRRAVGLDEIEAIVLPSDTSEDLKQQLTDLGIKYREYEREIPKQRDEFINYYDDLKFKLSNQNNDISPYKVKESNTINDRINKLSQDINNELTIDNDIKTYRGTTEEDADKFAPEGDIGEAPAEETKVYNEDTGNYFESPVYDYYKSKRNKSFTEINPEVHEFIKTEAESMLWELDNTLKGERSMYHNSETGENVWASQKRLTSKDIANIKDNTDYTYSEIEEGLRIIIEGKKSNAVSRYLEQVIDDRLTKGYERFGEQAQYYGKKAEANKEYINTLNAIMIDNMFKAQPIGEPTYLDNEVENPITLEEAKDIEKSNEPSPVARVLTETPAPIKESFIDKVKSKAMKFAKNFLDKGMVFENIAIRTGNRDLIAKWDSTLTSNSKGQSIIGNGYRKYNADTKKIEQYTKSLNQIREEVSEIGHLQEFYNYMYHAHNVDRMSIEDRAKAKMEAINNQYKETTNEEEKKLLKEEYKRLEKATNKPVFGYDITAEISKGEVAKYEQLYPEFKEKAQDIYDFLSAQRQSMVDSGMISQDTANLWSEMYPHYVPTNRVNENNNKVDVPLFTSRTGVKAPLKRATGGNSDILPLFDSMANRTMQTQRAIDRNSFGVELKNSLKVDTTNELTDIDTMLDDVDTQDELLQKNGGVPTFTIFENGEKVTYEITEDMYDALDVTPKILSGRSKILNKISNFQRNILTQYNPVFALTNAIKDAQDVLINSQHIGSTYKNFPKAQAEIINKGYYYQEYMANGGDQNTYFDAETKTLTETDEDKGIKKILKFPLEKIEAVNDFIEMTPRLAEYIASREEGRSIEVSMLDAARVTTNFKAGGDVTKFLNRNGATFLNASVQGFNQQVRNFREANANGLKGYAALASKFIIAGLPALLLNGLIWDDDEDYEELSDYVKQNYYVVAKYGDGKFVRIPKGRAVAVVQNLVDQSIDQVNGKDTIDAGEVLQLAVNNLAPNNPLENNVFSPIVQAATNKTWYGSDLVPTRLQNVPVTEQYDETTDSISKWLGQTLGISPYKINYIMNQYSGGVGDVVMPMLTPESKTGNDTLGEYLIAPLKDKFTTDSVFNNKNVSNFYSSKEEASVKAKSTEATDEDTLVSKFYNSIGSELNNLYKEKREIQNSSLSNKEKYSQVREIQKEIDELTKYANENSNDIEVTSNYARVGNRQYKLTTNDDGETSWSKLTEKEITKQKETTAVAGISNSEYQKIKVDLSNIKGDKDSNGKTISNSRKQKVFNYINSLNLSIGQKAVLLKNEYNSIDTYNSQILSLVNESELSYEERIEFLESLGFTIKNGKVYE